VIYVQTRNRTRSLIESDCEKYVMHLTLLDADESNSRVKDK